MSQKLLGEKFIQFVVKNILRVHNRRHPQKRLYIKNEDNPKGFCGDAKGNWWNTLLNMSKSGIPPR